MGELSLVIERLLQGLGHTSAGAKIGGWLSDNGYMPLVLSWSLVSLDYMSLP